MAVNIGPKIGIDGEKEYRKQINDLITQQKTFSAEMRELESSFDSETSAMEKNRKKGELLEKSIKNQEKQVEELEKGLEAAKDKYGENATQTQKWKQAVSNAKTELNKMRTELSKVP
jgi:chromosome segregation ATPase